MFQVTILIFVRNAVSNVNGNGCVCWKAYLKINPLVKTPLHVPLHKKPMTKCLDFKNKFFQTTIRNIAITVTRISILLFCLCHVMLVINARLVHKLQILLATNTQHYLVNMLGSFQHQVGEMKQLHLTSSNNCQQLTQQGVQPHPTFWPNNGGWCSPVLLKLGAFVY